MTIIAIGWTRGNKKALATIIPTKFWNKLRTLPKFDYYDIAAAHKIMKRDVGIAYIAMRKIHYNVMRFRDTVSVDEAEVLAGRFKSVSARYYVMHDPQKLTDKYCHSPWMNFGIGSSLFHDIALLLKFLIEFEYIDFISIKKTNPSSSQYHNLVTINEITIFDVTQWKKPR